MPSEATFTYSRKKETKGTVVFENDEAPINSVYVRKGNEFARAQKLELTLRTVNEDGIGGK